MPNSDPDRRREYQRGWIQAHPERHRELSREGMRRWRRRHPGERLARQRAYRSAKPERKRAWDERYAKAHPEVRLASHHNRRAREIASGGKFTAREWRLLVAEHGARCAYCGASLPLGPDHRIPLARGGTNDISNILPACAPCNRRKHTMTEAEFRARLRAEAAAGLRAALDRAVIGAIARLLLIAARRPDDL